MKHLKWSMLTMASIKLVIILTIAIQHVNGSQRIVQVSEFFSDDEDFFTSGENFASGDGDYFICCVYGNCSCHSLDYALTNLTSNVLINITTDMTLSSHAKVSDLQNVSIIGHNNPTVSCRNVGGMHFTFCHNCIIQGIIWNGCGTIAEPGLQLSYSSNIITQNCSFQHSIGQTVVLSEVAGDVNINHCQFVYNGHYRGHGAAIHYSSSNVTNHLQSLLTISNCNFTNNKGAQSLVYIENRISEHANNVMLYYSKFCHNQGTSIYVINQKLSLSGKLLFENNTAISGAGIHITDHSTVIVGRNSNVAFIQNSADNNGGAIFLNNHSTFLFDENSKPKFNYNKATRGTIYSEASSIVTFTGNCKITFSSNSATQFGAAIYSFDDSHVSFTGNSEVTFNNNFVFSHASFSIFQGGILYSENNSHISFEDNSFTVFGNNTADNDGGAIYSLYYSHISFKDNSSTIFGNNTADDDGGAIYSKRYSHISFMKDASTMFNNNTAEYGGAISSDDNSHISFEDNSSTIFDNNVAYFDGGAITSYDNSHISFEDNSSTIFGNNTADYGRAIHSNLHSSIYFLNDASTMFNNNTAEYGGAINSILNGHIYFEGNSKTKFNNNIAFHNGGTIYCYTSNISFSEYSTVIFRNNIADYGGTVFAEINSDVIFSDNSKIMFITNRATLGATVYSNGNSKITTKQNSTIIFDDHSAKWCTNTCLSYTGQSDVVTIDGNGIAWCSNQKSFICLSIECYCKNLEDTLNNTSNGIVNITEKVMTLSSFYQLNLTSHFSLIGHKNTTIICTNGGTLSLHFASISYNLNIEGLNWIGCGGYSDFQIPGYSNLQTPVIVMANDISRRSNIKIQKCSFQHSIAPAIGYLPRYKISFNNFILINQCSFMNNNYYRHHGVAIHYFSSSHYKKTHLQ